MGMVRGNTNGSFKRIRSLANLVAFEDFLVFQVVKKCLNGGKLAFGASDFVLFLQFGNVIVDGAAFCPSPPGAVFCKLCQINSVCFNVF